MVKRGAAEEPPVFQPRKRRYEEIVTKSRDSRRIQGSAFGSATSWMIVDAES